MTNRGKPYPGAAILVLILALSFFCSCAARETSQRQSTQQLVVTEYLLKDAGFKPWDVNDTTPKRRAMLEALPQGKISTFSGNAGNYYVYADAAGKTLYVGDEAAYQKYLSLAKGRNVCERVEGSNSAAFWSCFDETKTGGGRTGGK